MRLNPAKRIQKYFKNCYYKGILVQIIECKLKKQANGEFEFFYHLLNSKNGNQFWANEKELTDADK